MDEYRPEKCELCEERIQNLKENIKDNRMRRESDVKDLSVKVENLDRGKVSWSIFTLVSMICIGAIGTLYWQIIPTIHRVDKTLSAITVLVQQNSGNRFMLPKDDN